MGVQSFAFQVGYLTTFWNEHHSVDSPRLKHIPEGYPCPEDAAKCVMQNVWSLLEDGRKYPSADLKGLNLFTARLIKDTV